MRTWLIFAFLLFHRRRFRRSRPDYQWNLPKGFPKPYVPADNPMTAAKVELGRYLFYDTRMSVNGKAILRHLPQTGTRIHRRPRGGRGSHRRKALRAAP
jgi:cytochrome c peroxidase